MNLDEVKYNVKNGLPVSEHDYAYLLHHDRNALLGFLISNNPGSINNILRHELGYTELGFNPDKKAISRVLDIIIEKGNTDELKRIVEDFKIDTSKISPTLLNEIQSGGFNYELATSMNARTAQDVAASVGGSIGNFLNPIFGSTTTTTTTAPAPDSGSSSMGSKSLIVGVILLVLVAGAFLLLKKKTTA